MRDDKRGLVRFLPVVFMLYCLVVCLILLYLVAYPRVLGNVIGQGGNYTELRITQSRNTDSWYGFYGNLSNPGLGNMTFYGGDITFIDIYSDAGSTLVYASTSSDINWSAVTNATTAEVDAFLGVGPANIISGTSVFTETTDYVIEGTSITAHSTTTKSMSGTYDLGIMKYNNTLIFVSHIVNGLSFDNKTIDFQFMVPVPSGSNLTYYFGSYKPSSLGLNCTIGAYFNITLAIDNTSVDIVWPSVPGASSYSVYHIDNLTDLLFNFSNATVVSGLSNNWTDPAGGTRYYRVAAISGNGTCFFNMTGSRFEYDLIRDWNLISSPILFKNNTVKEVFRSIEGDYTNVNEFDNANQVYNYYIISGPTVFKNFDTIKPGNAYWIKVNSNITMVTVGKVFHNLSYPLALDWSLIGFPIVTFNDTVPYVLNQINGSYTNLNEFDNVGQVYNYYIVSGATVFSNFDTIKPGLGYWIKVNKNVTLNYTNEPYT